MKRKGRDFRKKDLGYRNCFTILHMSFNLQGFVPRINIYRTEEGRERKRKRAYTAGFIIA